MKPRQPLRCSSRCQFRQTTRQNNGLLEDEGYYFDR
jgi:hypothetical protein